MCVLFVFVLFRVFVCVCFYRQLMQQQLFNYNSDTQLIVAYYCLNYFLLLWLLLLYFLHNIGLHYNSVTHFILHCVYTRCVCFCRFSFITIFFLHNIGLHYNSVTHFILH